MWNIQGWTQSRLVLGNKKLRRGEDFDITASGKTQTLTIEKATEESVGEYRAEYKTASTSCKLSLAGMLILFRKFSQHMSSIDFDNR